MTNQTTKKLLAFIITIVFYFFILFSYESCQKEINTPAKTNDSLKTKASAGSSIIYTDVIPDSSIKVTMPSHATYNLDLNNDGIYDFTFSCSSSIGRCGAESGRVFRNYTDVSPIGSQNAILVSGTYPGALNINTVIGNGAIWSSASGQILRLVNACYWVKDGNWSTSEDKYLGLKINKGNKIFYGWIRLSVTFFNAPYSPNISILVRDYAYNSTSNKQILAGQTK